MTVLPQVNKNILNHIFNIIPPVNVFFHEKENLMLVLGVYFSK